MMYVGYVLGGPELSYSNFTRATSGISFPIPGEPWPVPGRAPNPTVAYSERHDPRPVGGLDLVFHVPGSILKPPFAGMRTGKFSRKERLLQIQIAVPEAQLDAPSLRQYLVDSVRSAIHLAVPKFIKAGIPYLPEEYLAQVDQLELRLGLKAMRP